MTKRAKSGKPKSGQRSPLTDLCYAALKRGPGTSDAIARRVRRPSRAVGKALSQLKRRGRAHFKRRDGEAIWTSGKARTR